MTALELLAERLKELGYDGLVRPHPNDPLWGLCHCKAAELSPHCCLTEHCNPGYLAPCDCGEHEWHIQERKA